MASDRLSLFKYVSLLNTDDEARAWLLWSREVLQGHEEDRKHLRKGRAERAVRSARTGVFRKPQRAYRPRRLK